MGTALFKQLETTAQGATIPLRDVLDALRFSDDGLIPAIAQQHDTGEVVMVGYMNRATLEETLTTGRVCYYSRSRDRVWRKGEESGNIQLLKDLRIDCDGDALLLRVDQRGPACHTGRHRCFYLKVDGDRVIVTDAIERRPEDMYRSTDRFTGRFTED
jgi:phosphoribosyl-AMP cyclohydrolase